MQNDRKEKNSHRSYIQRSRCHYSIFSLMVQKKKKTVQYKNQAHTPHHSHVCVHWNLLYKG